MTPRIVPRITLMGANRAMLPAVAILLSQWSVPAQGATPAVYQQAPAFDLRVGLGTTGDWKAVVTAALEPKGEIDSGEGNSQSKICFVRTAPAQSECAWFRDLFESNLKFQELSSLSVVQLQSGTPVDGLVMKAAALYPTGQEHETAIWVYDRLNDRFRLVSAVKSGEVRIFSSGPLNGVLATADWHREEGENRWSDHPRDITVYRYGEAGYRKVLAYTTARKYGAEDTSTVDAELAAIEARLR